jgi:hypothetical protein
VLGSLTTIRHDQAIASEGTLSCIIATGKAGPAFFALRLKLSAIT